MAEPIARVIVRDVEHELRLVGAYLGLPYHEQVALRERLVHVVDADIKRGLLRLLEEPTALVSGQPVE